MKTKYLTVIYVLVFSFTFAQQKISYQTRGNIIDFTISENEFYIMHSKSDDIIINSLSSKQEYQKISKNSAIITIKQDLNTYNNKKHSLLKNQILGSERIEPVLIYKDGTKQMTNGEISIKVKPNTNINHLISKWNFKVIKNPFEKYLYLLSSNTYTTEEIFNIVNELQNKKEVEYVEPNFIKIITQSTNDPYYKYQWSIKNQGYYGGVIGADMKVEEAWKYSTGNGIKVAVLDSGVDLNHPDLKDNILQGYDATGENSNGAPDYTIGSPHGTACAGIIASVANNNIGTVGIAHNSKIIPIRIGFTNINNGNTIITSDIWKSNSINWAWQNGADVLSNSWGGGSHSYAVENAIKNAVEKGRNGKGSVVLFASGNNNSQVIFPATLPNVIAVGASSMCDERKSPNSCDFDSRWGSNYGSHLDLVAPGVNIYTTDVSGANGYTYGDYKSDFNGTSSACPNVAGVMALILSANPNLTQKQARDILEQSTDKVRTDLYQYQTISGYDNGTWNNEVGYGRVNALKAIQKVYAQKFNIQGSSVICDNTTHTYTIDNNDDNSIQWQLSSDIEEVSRTANSIIIKPKSGFNGLATLTASNGNGNTTKKIWVGKPKVKLKVEPHRLGVKLWAESVVDGVSLADQGISIQWKNHTTGETYNGIRYNTPANGNTMERVEATISNNCGSEKFEKWVARTCDNDFLFSLTKTYSDNYTLTYIRPCVEPGFYENAYTTYNQSETFTIQISNAMGQIVLTTKNKEFSLAHLLAGTYYARVIKNGQVVHTQTLLKQ